MFQVKLQSNREQLIVTRKQCETADANVASLERKVQDLQTQLDQAKGQINKLSQEKELNQKTLESLRTDKAALEKNRVEINSMVNINFRRSILKILKYMKFFN